MERFRLRPGRRPGGLRRAAPALALALLLAGCRPGGPEAGPAAGPGIEEAEVERLVERLAHRPDPVPLPEPLPTPSAGAAVTRLLERFDDAEVEWQGTGEERAERVLARFERSELSGEGGRVRRYVRGLAGTRYRWLELPGLGLDCEEVGEIRFRARLEGASRLLVSWLRDKPAAALELEIARGEAARDYSIATDELVHWRGELPGLWLGVPLGAAGDGRLELEWLELSALPPAFPSGAGVRRWRMGEELRRALYLRGGAAVAFRGSTAAPSPRLTLAVAAAGEAATLRVTAGLGSGARVLFEEPIGAANRWRELDLELPRGAGERLDLRFEAEGPPGRVLLLADPTLYTPRPDPPRVFVYLIDTLGAAHASLHGYPRPTTPRLEALAAEGAWFVNAFANASRTRESVPSLMTSLHPVSHGVLGLFSRLSPDFVTLADAYAAAGFATAAFSTNPNAGPGRGTDQGFDSFFDHVAWNEDREALRTVPIPQVLSWLRRHPERPTFVYIHTAEPHHPYAPPPPFDTLYDPEGEGEDAWFSRPPARFDGEPASRERLERVIARYDGEVAFADTMLGALLDLLAERRLLGNALVAVTSDHGEEFFEHGRALHGGSVYTPLLRVPLVLWGPRYLEAPRRIDPPVQLLDLMPTLLELSGLAAGAPMQGTSLAAALAGGDAGWLEERPLLLMSGDVDPPQLALVAGGWKLNLGQPAGSADREVELFDLARDPWESEDLVEKHPDRAREMLRALQTVWSALPRYAAAKEGTVEVSPEQIDRLRALGYVQ